jgi:putative inorganic carbon (hco3(-)) transporter
MDPLLLIPALAGAVAAAYLAWHTDPAVALSLGVVLSVFAGNWDQVGIPGQLAPDRLLLVAGIATVLLRGPAMRDRAPLRIEPVHWLTFAVALYAIVSAILAGTLLETGPFFELLEQLGLVPFAVFLVAQVAFRTPRQRRILLGALVALGGYLGLTALLEATGARALIVPPYIADPSVGIHFGRARGPFLEAVTNGVGLFACAVAAGVALAGWRGRAARLGAGLVLALCTLGLLFTLQRSIWVASVAAGVVTLLAVPELRRRAVPALAAGVVAVAIALAVVPGLSDRVDERRGADQSVWDRKNLSRASLNMIDAQPLVGFGWASFTEESVNYFELSDSYPLTAAGLEVHNVYLSHGAELGLIGLTLWAFAVLAAVIGALTTRGPPELRRWKIAFGAYAVFYSLVAAFVPAQVFPVLLFWLLAGVVWAGRLEAAPAWSAEPIRARRAAA